MSQFRIYGGQKLVATPDGAERAPRPRTDNAMVRRARAFRWRKMLDESVHATLVDLVKAKGVAPSYVSRVLRLTLLAPELVEATLDGRQPAELQLNDLLGGSRWRGSKQLKAGRALRRCRRDQARACPVRLCPLRPAGKGIADRRVCGWSVQGLRANFGK